MPSDRRQHDRYRFWIPIELVVGDQRLPAIGHDMSRRGAALVCRRSVDVDVEVELHFQLPPGEGDMRRVGAIVRRAGPNAADPRGLWPFELGIEFTAEVPGLEDDLQELLSRLGGRNPAR